MHIAILRTAAWRVWLGRIIHIDEDESRSTCAITWRSPNSYSIVLLLVDYDVVRSAKWQANDICNVTSADGVRLHAYPRHCLPLNKLMSVRVLNVLGFLGSTFRSLRMSKI